LGQKAEKRGIKAEWEAEWATKKVDQLDTPLDSRKEKIKQTLSENVCLGLLFESILALVYFSGPWENFVALWQYLKII